MDIPTLRAKIDNLDAELVSLLNERANVAVNIGLLKKEQQKIQEQTTGTEEKSGTKGQVFVPAREIDIYERLKTLNHGPLKDDAVCAIFREIMSASISLQREVIIAFLGPKGTFTHQAASERFGDSVVYADQSTIADVFTSVEKGHATYGVIPFENSTHGSVTQTLDRFIQSDLQIRAEHYMTVHHSLLSRCSSLSDIECIYSHPEAFGQCEKYLERYLPKTVRKIHVSSTAHAAKSALETPNSAAIASSVCADLYGLNVLAKDIEDLKGNTTRFFIISTASDKAVTGKDKTLLLFTMDHRQPGALADVLSVFKKYMINLTKIDSRPTRSRPWHYYFFIEIESHNEQPNLQSALEEMKKYCSELKVLGSYPDQKPVVV